MVVDGVELLRMIRDGEIKDETKIYDVNTQENVFRYIKNKDGFVDQYHTTPIMNYYTNKDFSKAEFKILSEEDKEIDIQAIEELDACAMVPDGMNGTKLYYSVQEGLIIKQQNRIIKALKQLDKKIK